MNGIVQGTFGIVQGTFGIVQGTLLPRLGRSSLGINSQVHHK